MKPIRNGMAANACHCCHRGLTHIADCIGEGAGRHHGVIIIRHKQSGETIKIGYVERDELRAAERSGETEQAISV